MQRPAFGGKASFPQLSALTDTREKLPDETRNVLDLVWNTYLNKADWPKTRVIESRSSGPKELKRLLNPIDGSYIVENEPEHAPKLELRILGILCTAQRKRYLKLLEGYLKFLRNLYHKNPEQEVIHRDEVAKFLNLADDDAADLGRLLGFVAVKGIFNASGSYNGAWQFGVPKRINEIPPDPLDDFLDTVLLEYFEPGSKIWLQERRAQQIATGKAIGYYEAFESLPKMPEPAPFERWYQVFVSSTYKDLKTEREHVAQALLLTRCIPSGMEFFPASGRPPWDVIKREIDEADYYVLLVAGRYGSFIPGGALSYTEREFDYALEIGKQVIVFCFSNIDSLPSELRNESQLDEQKLAAFRKKAQSGRTCKFWSTATELESAVKTALLNAILKEPSPGWIRANSISPDSLGHLDLPTREGAEMLLQIMWAAKRQRIANSELTGILHLPSEKAQLMRDKLFEASVANRMDNLEDPGNHWIVFTEKGRSYVIQKNIQHRIPTVEKFGLTWNERREPVCAKCILPLPFFDNRSLRCSQCGTDIAPHDSGKALSVNEALEKYGGRLAS